MNNPDVQTAQLSRPPELQSFDFISDVPVTLHAELDRRSIEVHQLLKLEVNSVLPMTRPAGENIDLYLGRVLIGSGEVLVVDGMLVLRVSDLRDKKTEHGPGVHGERDAL